MGGVNFVVGPVVGPAVQAPAGPQDLTLPGQAAPAQAVVGPAPAAGDVAQVQQQPIQAAAAGVDLAEVKLPEDFMKAADKNADGYLSGNEISPALKAHFPNQARITQQDLQGLLAKQEAAWKAEFKQADKNGDGWLSGNELTAALKKYDQGNNFKLPNGQTVVELTQAEFLAGRRAEFLKGLQLPPGAEPVGGGVPAAPAPAEVKPAAPTQEAAPAAKPKRKKKRRWLKRLMKMGKVAFKMAFAPQIFATRLAIAQTRATVQAVRTSVKVAVNVAPQVFRVVSPLPPLWPRILPPPGGMIPPFVPPVFGPGK